MLSNILFPRPGEEVISQGRKTPDATRAEIVRALLLDPTHNASRVARQFGVSNKTVRKFAEACDIPLIARSFNNPSQAAREAASRRMHRLWANPIYSQIMSDMLTEAAFERRQPRIIAKRLHKLNRE